jgi:DnaJ-class molecular chaperone
MTDPYEILGIAKTASETEVKKAFRTLAKKHHPDKHAGDAAAKKRFQEISGAYDILGDKQKRAQYDAGAIGADGNPRGFDPRQGGGGFRQANPFGGGFGGGGGPGGREFHFSFDDAPGGPAGFQDIFADLMGGGRRGAKAGQARASKGEDFAAAVTVSFAEAAIGGTRRVMLQNGEQIDVKIPAGVKEGQAVRVKGRGGAGHGGPNGDILLTVSVAPHPFMTRDGNDIRMDLPVTLKEAVEGGKVPVPTLTGTVSVSVPPNSNTGTVLRLKGKGIAANGGAAAGDFYVRLAVTLPDKPDESLRAFVQGWTPDHDPRAKMR